MRKQIIKTMLAFVAIGIFLFGCSKSIDYPIPEVDQRIVLSGILKVDLPAQIKLTHSNSITATINENRNPWDLNSPAQVKLFQNDTFLEDLVQEPDGDYYGQKLLSEGVEYTIKVEHKDYENVSSTAKIMKAVDIKSIDTLTEMVSDEFDTWETSIVKVTFDDPADEENFYLLHGYSRISYTYYGEHMEETNSMYLDNYQSDLGFQEINDGVLIPDFVFDGKTAEVKVSQWVTRNIQEYSNYGYSDLKGEIIMTLTSISKDYYNYLRSYDQFRETEDFGIFTEPVQVYSNVENGLGILGSANPSSKTFTIK